MGERDGLLKGVDENLRTRRMENWKEVRDKIK